jgi:hypothetical protein
MSLNPTCGMDVCIFSVLVLSYGGLVMGKSPIEGVYQTSVNKILKPRIQQSLDYRGLVMPHKKKMILYEICQVF